MTAESCNSGETFSRMNISGYVGHATTLTLDAYGRMLFSSMVNVRVSISVRLVFGWLMIMHTRLSCTTFRCRCH